MSAVEDAVNSLVASQNASLSSVSVKAVGSQIGLMTAISLATILGFSFFRPREKKVYAPKIKYQLPEPSDPSDDPDYEPPPPPISNGFFAWFSPVIRLKEEQMISNIGLDATTFLRFLRMLRNIFSCISVLGVALLVLNIIYNLKYVNSQNRNALSLLTIQNVKGAWMWPALAATYLINAIVMYFVWRNWHAMILLRTKWFRSPAYQTKIYSRTLMVTQVRKDYRSDEGLVALMGLLKVDGIKIGPEIDCTSIGRRLEDFPEMVEDHNKAVTEIEEHLVKYLKGGVTAKTRPTIRKGAFLGMCGGTKKDAIDYHAKEIKFLRDKIDVKRQAIDSLLRKERHARKKGQNAQRIEGENYGFVTFKTIAEAHRIARAHQGRLKELHGAQLQLAPMPQDIVWQNISKDSAEIGSRRTFGFIFIGTICFFYTVPLLVVSLLANLSSLTVWVAFLDTWKNAGGWGNWTFSLVSGILPSVISAGFGYFLPYIMRRISKYQGATTRSRLDRAVTARYFFFMIICNLVIYSLLSVVYTAVATVIVQVGKHQSVKEIFKSFEDIPDKIQGTYVQQSTYWLTWLPLRGFLVIFELIQLIKLAMVSLRRFMFSHTPRSIRDMTKPGYFEYAIIIVNLLFVCAVGMIYAPLAPLVAIGACAVFWFSSIVYKYQLLYVYISRAESGGRMWNVYVNRLLACCVLMQLLMVLTTGLIRSRWLDSVAAAPPVFIIIGFKIYISRTIESKFRYFEPTQQELEQERIYSMSEKRTRHSEMEKRFLHPALQQDKLFTVMVHKSQEALAREVLSAYPWFAGKHEHDGVVIKAVREENLEYDPNRDGPADVAHQADWDARSIASTEMLGGFGGGKSELSSTAPSPGLMTNEYGQYPLPNMGSTHNLPMDNPSTDYLLAQSRDRSEEYQSLAKSQPKRSNSRPYPLNHRSGNLSETDIVASSPLLENQQYSSMSYDVPPYSNVPYPPSAYTQPPIGYTPPTMRRTASGNSDSDIGVGVGQTRWDQGDEDRSERGYNQPTHSSGPRPLPQRSFSNTSQDQDRYARGWDNGNNERRNQGQGQGHGW
ncbi:uncharacterized protein IL334_007827 [Kwoniella shivajii]|uniref:DUF221-domain-containing protein n=1 Tax=Kwoniella shivajii TaxID=564305 RepID=A0ABZ1DAL2_9TREE|nr:hypothetical protein IL334_007827 [Kwoniella shivajii]